MGEKFRKLKIHFILPSNCETEDDCSPAMLECYEECVSKCLKVDWVKDPFQNKVNLTKNNIFVLENFSGEIYEKITAPKTSFRVVGPYCLLTCMNKSIPTPDVPTLTMAMDKLSITFSCLSKEVKTELAKKIKLMAGVVNSCLLEETTHLVVGTANSPKYEKANERGVNIMTQGWVDAVFIASQHSSLTHASDHEFKRFKCPVFYNLGFTLSGYGSKIKETYKTAIESNGGTYYPSLQFRVTDILICDKSVGDKYKHAREWGLPCITADWIEDSVKEGYSLPFKKYYVAGYNTLKCSTPTKEEIPSKFHNSDISISMIHDHNKTHVTESQSSCFTTPKLTTASYDYAKAVDDIDLLVAKKSDSFLDGCNIFLWGFNSAQEEKLRKLIKLGSGVRFTEMDESVSHIIMGARVTDFHKMYSSLSSKPHIVTVEWLKQSILLKSPAPENLYHCFTTKVPSTVSKAPECPSPLSRKGLQMLISPAKPKSTPKVVGKDSPAARKLLQGYLDSQNEYESSSSQQPEERTSRRKIDTVKEFKVPEQPLSVATQDMPIGQSNNTESSTLNSDIFIGLTFIVLGFEEEGTAEIIENIKEAKGKVVTNGKTFRGIPDYIIVPFSGMTTQIVPTEDVVTDIWLMECKQHCQLIEVQYYHRPIQVLNKATPLTGCVITISNYVGFERDFLGKLSQLLGAGYQEEFMKRDNPKNNKKASTHLVCPTCVGSKYNAAIKWNFPSVTKKWLLECAKSGTRLLEDTFLTGSDDMNHNQSFFQNGMPAEKNDTLVTRHSQKTNGESRGEPNNRENAIETKENVLSKDNTLQDSSREKNNSQSSQQSSQFSQRTGGHARKRKLSVLNNVESAEDLNDSPTKRAANESRSFSQTSKLASKEERKRWEKIMDSFIDDDKILPPPRRKKVNSQLESSFESNGSGPNQSQSKGETQPSELAKTIDELNQQLSRAKTRNSDETSPPKRNSVHQRKYVTAGKEESQPNVGWEDYVETLEKNAKDSGNDSNSEKCFVLSNVNDDIKLKYCEIVNRLGGTLLNTSQCFESQTTHLIMESPLRSEKLLCCLASGKWILIPRYLEDCDRLNTFLPEQEYEFGNPFSANKMPPLEGQIVQYAEAAYRWRIKKGGAFKGMKATLYVSEKRIDSLRRLIRAGGGEVLDNSDALKGTHCFWEDTRIDMPISLEEFARQGVYVLPPVYLADYLRHEPSLNPVDCLVGSYKSIYENAVR